MGILLDLRGRREVPPRKGEAQPVGREEVRSGQRDGVAVGHELRLRMAVAQVDA